MEVDKSETIAVVKVEAEGYGDGDSAVLERVQREILIFCRVVIVVILLEND